MLIIDLNGRIEHACERTAILLGVSQTELIGATLRAVVSRNDPNIEMPVADAGSIALLLKSPNSTRGQWQEGQLTLTAMEAHGRRFVIGHLQPLGCPTPDRSTECQQVRLRQFADVGAWDWDLDARMVHWSDAVAVLFGHPRSELQITYENFLAAVHPSDRRKIAREVAGCLDDDLPFELDYRVVWPNGTVRWLSACGRVLRNGAGRPLRMMGVVRDITNRKHMETRLRKARIEAEAAGQGKSRFIQSLSHALRTPLTAVLGFSEMLLLDHEDLSDTLTSGQVEGLEHVLGAGRHLLDLVDDVLDLATLNSGHFKVTVEPVLVWPVLEECVCLCDAAAQRAGVKVWLDEPEPAARQQIEAWVAQVDLRRFQQIVLNLLSNAIKYNRPNGAVHLRVKLHERSGTIEVQDSGIGIPEAQRDKVFTAFDRLGAEQTAIKGTGIGLSICHELARNMSADIGFDSTVGVGTTFWLKLPSSSSSTPPRLFTQSCHGTSRSAFRERLGDRALTILHVDDSPPTLALVKAVFSRFPGIDLRSADSTVSARDALREEVPDLVFLDVRLGDESGYKLLRILKGSIATQRIPVIALSASASPEEIRLGLMADFDAYLGKPIQFDRLLETCVRLLKI